MSLVKRLLVFSLVITTVLWSVGATFSTAKAAGTYGGGSLLALEGVSGAAVYYIGSDGDKYVFPDPKTYDTWYDNFDNVVRVDVAELDMYPDGGAVTYRPGTKLITHENTAKIYAVGPSGALHWLPTGAIAEDLYGADWGTRVLDVIPGFFSSSYTSSSDLSDTLPDGTIVSSGGDWYYIMDGEKRPFASADAFEANNYRESDLLPVADVSGYGDGDSITGEEEDLSGYMPGEVVGPVGDGKLTVSLASDTPAAGIVVGGASRYLFTKVNFTNTGTAEVTVDRVVVERKGLAQDAVFASLDLLDGSNLMAALNRSSKTLGSVHTASFNDDFTVAPGATKPVYVAANMASSLASYAGEMPALAITSVELADGTVSGSFPLTGNAMTLNGTLSIGTATIVAGGNNPSAVTKEVGTTNYIVTSFKITAGAAEDVTVDKVTFTNNGSSDPEDVENLRLVDANTTETYCTWDSVTSDSFTCDLDKGIEKGKNNTFDLKLDVINGSASQISYDIDKQADVTVVGDTYGYNILPTYTGTSAEPYFDAANTTIGDGTLNVESVAVAPSNVTEGLSGVTLGKFKFVAKGEAMNITSIGWNFDVTTSTAGADASDITNITIYDEDGSTVAGPMDLTAPSDKPADGTATTTDAITVPVGETTYTVKADLSTDFNANDTIQVGTFAALATLKGEITGNTVTPTPSGNTQSTSLTVRSASLVVTVSSQPNAQTIVAGANELEVANFILDGSTSGDTVRVSSIKPKITTTGSAYPNQVSGWKLYDGSALLPIAGESTSCSGATCNVAATIATTTLTLANYLEVAPGATKTVKVKVNVGTGATSGSVAIGLSSAAGITAIDSDAQAITPSGTDSTGNAMTLSTGGTLYTAIATDPGSDLVVAGTTVEVGRFSLHPKYENMDINYFGFSLANPDGGIVGNQDELDTLYLYEDGGSSALGSVTITSNRATITPSSLNLAVSEGEKVYIVKGILLS